MISYPVRQCCGPTSYPRKRTAPSAMLPPVGWPRYGGRVRDPQKFLRIPDRPPTRRGRHLLYPRHRMLLLSNAASPQAARGPAWHRGDLPRCMRVYFEKGPRHYHWAGRGLSSTIRTRPRFASQERRPGALGAQPSPRSCGEMGRSAGSEFLDLFPRAVTCRQLVSWGA